MKRTLSVSIMITVIVILSILFVSLTSYAQFNITHVTTSSTSGRYPWGMAVGEVINKYIEGVSCKTRAIGSVMTHPTILGSGEAQMTTFMGIGAAEDAYYGTGPYEGNEPVKNIRLVCMRETPLVLLFVTKSSGIKSMEDLKGKKISAGLPESLARRCAMALEEELNTGVIYTFDSFGNAITELKNRRIDGIWTSSPGLPPGPNYGTKFNAQMLEINATIPLSIVGFTEEEKNLIEPKFQEIRWSNVPAGGVENLPELGSFWAYRSGWTGVAITTEIPQDIQYEIIKALDEHWTDEITVAYPPCGAYTPIKDTIDLTVAWGNSLIPFAAGFVQYAKEKGYDIPSELIPLEYQEVK